MAEGGLFPWKMQRISNNRGPRGNYNNLRDPLPKPPAGMMWQHNKESREWRLVKQPDDDLSFVNEENQAAAVVDTLPGDGKGNPSKEEEWELLSDRVSTSSTHTGGVVVLKPTDAHSSSHDTDGGGSGSDSQHFSSGHKKLQRATSNSTIDSVDNALGPSGKGVLGVDYVEHVLMPSDTLQGICLAYKISSTRLKQANHFSGHSLSLAPKKLVIPMSKKARRSGCIRVQDTSSKEYKLHAFQAEFPDLSIAEAKAYLELADWVLYDAIHSAKEDNEWEKELDQGSLRAGEIRITMNCNEGIVFRTQGAGIHHAESNETKEGEIDSASISKKKPALTAYEAVPLMKTVKPEDIYKAAPQHDCFGVELQTLTKKDGAMAQKT